MGEWAQIYTVKGSKSKKPERGGVRRKIYKQHSFQNLKEVILE